MVIRFFMVFMGVMGFFVYPSLQELPPVISFAPEDYRADNQNWSIAQDESKHIFVANNKGLLEYNGDSWQLYPSPNESIIRSVYVHRNTVYSGCFRDFGYWERDETGHLNYRSIVKKTGLQVDENEEFWTILSYDHWVVFQSLDAVYIYDTEGGEIQKIEVENGVTKIMKAGGEIYFSEPRKGIYKIVNGDAVLVSDHPLFQDNLVLNLYDLGGQLLVQTNVAGIYTLEANPVSWGGENAELFRSLAVYSSLQTQSGNIILGTISEGVVKINSLAEVEYQITKNESLSNNTVLSVFEDRAGNIWLGLDNGVNCINQSSAISIFYDKSGELGTIYASTVFEQKLYLGSNQGLFFKNLNSDINEPFQLIEGSVGQVWDLFVYDDHLFCAHNDGTFQLVDNRWTQISEIPGTWCFKPVPGRPDLLIQGNYQGLSLLEKAGGAWQLRNVLLNFSISSRFIEFIDPVTVLVDHEYKGVYRIHLSEDYSEVIKVERDSSVERGLYSSIVRFEDRILYANEKGIRYYQMETNRFVKDDFLSGLYDPDSYSSGKLVVTDNGKKLWIFSKGSIFFIAPGKLSDDLQITTIPIHYSIRNAMVGYENIFELSDDIYLFGNSQGYFLINLKDFKNRTIESVLTINRVTKGGINQVEEKRLPLNEKATLKNRYNHIRISYSIPEFEKHFTSEYQYKLLGHLEDWTPWQAKNEAVFSNLPYGSYEFLVRGRIGEDVSSEPVHYSFKIERPFVLSNLMLGLYSVAFLFLVVFIHSTYKNYYKKQREKLELKTQRELAFKESENKRKLMRLKNEKLQQDIEGKNRELAISTMSLIKKNRVLNGIKSELGKLRDDQKEVKKVVALINKNLKSSDDWEFFERAFNNADREFFKKIKEKHPGLTPDDLRLCAYLRLNLSSKEMAPLLSISPKSVEIKRYRLRKKMELNSDVNLTAYILEI